MWDVKELELEENIRLAKFYLNYVGCKDMTEVDPLWQNDMFYLNYVGCKGFTQELDFPQHLPVLSELCGM